MRLVRRLVRPSLAFAMLVLWLIATFATEVHDTTARHMVCPEHGELVELGPTVAADPHEDEGPSLTAAPEAPHQDGCTLPPCGTGGPPTFDYLELPELAPTAQPVHPPRTGRWARCALSFAPKTSPPRA